jgi:SOS response associated peptidase (SRAP)
VRWKLSRTVLRGGPTATLVRLLGARTGKTKQPYCFEVKDGELFAFAGIWDRWKDPSGNWMKTCSILTTTPNTVTSVVHDRMPVILDPDSYDLWLDPGMNNVTAATDLLKPCDPRLMRCYPVPVAPFPWLSMSSTLRKSSEGRYGFSRMSASYSRNSGN